MYNDSATSDVRFTFGNNQSGEVVYAHKYVLAISSPVFYEIFYGKSEKNIVDIHLPHGNNETVADFFGFLYEDKCPASTAKNNDSFEKGMLVLRLVMQYQVTSFDKACGDFMELTPARAFEFLEHFIELSAERHVNVCLDYIDKFSDEYFTSKHFLNVKLNTLGILLLRDTLEFSEVKLFKAVVTWADYRCLQQNLQPTQENRKKILGKAIYDIRFLLMSLNQFIAEVVPVAILSDQESIGIIKALAGHPVADLIWDSPTLRRQRTPKSTGWWPVYAAIILILFSLFCFRHIWSNWTDVKLRIFFKCIEIMSWLAPYFGL